MKIHFTPDMAAAVQEAMRPFLRQTIASQALSGLLSSDELARSIGATGTGGLTVAELYADTAVAMADALLARLER